MPAGCLPKARYQYDNFPGGRTTRLPKAGRGVNWPRQKRKQGKNLRSSFVTWQVGGQGRLHELWSPVNK